MTQSRSWCSTCAYATLDRVSPGPHLCPLDPRYTAEWKREMEERKQTRDREEERSIAEHLQHYLRERGYDATVTVKHEGDGRFFASNPTKVPVDVWQAAIDDLYPSRPMWQRIVLALGLDAHEGGDT